MIYMVCIVVVTLCAFIAERSERKVPIFLIAVILSLFCGLRGVTVGVDTGNYYIFLNYIRELGISFGSDIGFSIISYFLMGFFDNPHYVLLIYATLTNFLIVYRLWDFRQRASFPLMILIYAIIHYSYTFNIVRQFLAISIVFFATRYLEKKENIKYIIMNTLAVTIHASSVLGFCFLFVSFGFERKTKKVKLISFAFAVVSIIVGIFIFSSNIDRYDQHFLSITSSIHLMTILKLTFVFAIIIVGKLYKNTCFSSDNKHSAVPMNKEVPTMYQFALILSMLGMFFPFMNRVGFYFILYELPFWGQVVRAKKNKSLYRMMISAILLYTFVVTLLTDTSGLIDYVTFLQD